MLENLHIKNAALIAECDLQFASGLNILTGETGAGKSMVLGSLQFVLGGRVTKDFLRKEEKAATVEALFSTENSHLQEILQEHGIEIEEDNTLLIRRTLYDTGKSICRVNGCTVTLGILREIAGELIDVYGQHEHQSLLNPAKHICLLDRFCAENLKESLESYHKYYEMRKNIEKQLALLMGDEGERSRKIDILQFQIEEITRAKLQQGEEEVLLEQKKRLSSKEKLMRLTEEGVAMLYGGAEGMPSVYDCMGQILHRLGEAVELDSTLAPLAETLDSVYVLLADSAREWKRYGEGLEADSDALEEIEERLQTIYHLKRKYGGSVEEVLSFCEKAQEKLDFLIHSEEKAAELEKQKRAAEHAMIETARDMTEIRRKKADEVGKQIEDALHEMQMQQAQFCIKVEEKDVFGTDGRDKVEFFISANAGEDLKPLSKIASGGEMSRVMLALKSVLVDADEIDTFVFDEIDTGVSGKTAGKVGEKMHILGQKRQILCITHLPQIAAMADHHFRIEKQVIEGKTETKVYPLDEESSCMEIARLMGGEEVTDAVLAAAKELRKECQSKAEI